jgi:hypothetical protein
LCRSLETGLVHISITCATDHPKGSITKPVHTNEGDEAIFGLSRRVSSTP